MRLNLVDFEKAARRIGGAKDQVPFALSVALNQAARKTKRVLVDEVWPRSVTVRNAAFMGRALQIVMSTKRDLRIEIYDDLQRANLKLHADGGTRKPRGAHLAIPPTGSVQRGSRGVWMMQRPRTIIAQTPKRALRITPRGIFVGKGGRLQLKFALRTSAQQPKDVPFRESFEGSMRAEVVKAFPSAMSKAMRTAFR